MVKRNIDNFTEEFDKTWDNVMGNKPNYYAIIPAYIRYDQKLTHLEKLLYGEITCLSNKQGFCYATNQYFSELYGNSERTISRSVNRLQVSGYITVALEVVAGTKKTNRKIYLNEATKFSKDIQSGKSFSESVESNLSSDDKNVVGGTTKMSEQGRQKGLTNTTSNNTTSIIDSGAKATANNLLPVIANTEDLDIYKEDDLPSWLGNNYIARLVGIYRLAWNYNLEGLQCYEKATGRNMRTFRDLHRDYTEYMIAYMIFLHFQWKGISGEAEWINKRLSDSAFPIAWLSTNANSYLLYLEKTLGVKNKDDLKKYVDKAIKVCLDKK